jgi:hypothetical protein
MSGSAIGPIAHPMSRTESSSFQARPFDLSFHCSFAAASDQILRHACTNISTQTRYRDDRRAVDALEVLDVRPIGLNARRLSERLSTPGLRQSHQSELLRLISLESSTLIDIPLLTISADDNTRYCLNSCDIEPIYDMDPRRPMTFEESWALQENIAKGEDVYLRVGVAKEGSVRLYVFSVHFLQFPRLTRFFLFLYQCNIVMGVAASGRETRGSSSR